MWLIVAGMALICSSNVRSDSRTFDCTVTVPEPPSGYTWSLPLSKPPQMALGTRESLGDGAGAYDFFATPVGDNWSIGGPSPYVTIRKPAGATFSFRMAFPVDEPSCGFLGFRRGPYVDGAAEGARGRWQAGQPENAGPFSECSMPIFTHHGGDWNRYQFGGWQWRLSPGWAYYDIPGYWQPRVPVGPLKLDGVGRMAIAAPTASPDITLLSAVPNVELLVSMCWVDQFGRESELSDPLQVPALPGTTDANCVEIRRPCQPPQGACAVRLYTRTAGDAFRRQPVLGRQGAVEAYDWPLHLSRYYLHSLRTDSTNPLFGQTECRSWLNPLQRQIEQGKTEVNAPGMWNLHCPLILPYTVVNGSVVSRTVGDPVKRTKLVQVGSWSAPAIIVLSQRETCFGLDVSAQACAAIASSDFSGGQAFGAQLYNCSFVNTAEDGYGLLVDECASIWPNNHTASEWVVRNCKINAARPVKLEGIQTAKMRFDDRCEFTPTGPTRYPAEVCALEIFTSNAVVFNDVKGINTEQDSVFKCRTLFGLFNPGGQPTVRVRDFFSDRGCSVGFAFGPNTGGRVIVEEGEKIGIYASDRQWFRLVEAPNSRNSSFSARGLLSHPKASVLSYNLNALSINSDAPIAEVVTASEADWTARGMQFVINGHDWRMRPAVPWQFGFSGVADGFPVKSPTGSVVVQP